MIYELLSGRRAFDADSFAATLYKILQEFPEPLQQIDPAIPIELVRIVERALAKPRDERYQHMSEMLLDLAVFRQQLAGMDSPAGGRLAPTELRTPSDRPFHVTPPIPLPPVATPLPLTGPSTPAPAPRRIESAGTLPASRSYLLPAHRGPRPGDCRHRHVEFVAIDRRRHRAPPWPRRLRPSRRSRS